MSIIINLPIEHSDLKTFKKLILNLEIFKSAVAVHLFTNSHYLITHITNKKLIRNKYKKQWEQFNTLDNVHKIYVYNKLQCGLFILKVIE